MNTKPTATVCGIFPALSPEVLLRPVRRLEDIAIGSFRGRDFIPPLDVLDKGTAWEVRVEFPGARKEDFLVNMEDGVLTVSGKREGQDPNSYLRKESYSGSFTRSVPMPDAAVSDGAKATYSDGVLTVEIAKAEGVKPVTIPISG